MHPLKKGKIATQAHTGLPQGTFEEEHGRKGFYGKAAHLYHAHPPTGWIRFEGKLRPHCFDLNELNPPDLNDAEGLPVPFLGNDDVKLYVSRRSEPMPFYYRNADGDELMFVHRGKGYLETDFGPLEFERGDYLNIPRAVTYRVVPETRDNFFLLIQSRGEFDPPDKGLLGQHALYDPAVIVTPEPAPLLEDNNEWEVRIKADGEISKVVYPFNPIDVVGWKGDLTVWKINIRDIRPVMSHRAHLPPSAHTTFVTAGAVVCSFVPRPLEEEEDALRVPFFHRNTDYDEFLFYHDGDFFSKDNIKAGMATLHPRGIHHGPHPKALANQKKKTHTDEYAVMLDGLNPIRVLPAGEAVEWKDYWASWMEKEARGDGPQPMIVDPAAAAPVDIYKLLIGAIVPRPIAFVSTISPEGIRNLAPFSFFTAISANPPVICFSPMVRGNDAARKDTLRNIERTGEFVVNVVSEEFVRQMNICSAEFPPEIDEFEASGLTPISSDVVKPPRVKESHIHMECTLVQIVEVSAKPLGGSIVLGQVVRFHVDDAIVDNYRIDAGKLRPVGRMGGPTYTRTTDRFDLDRPKMP